MLKKTVCPHDMLASGRFRGFVGATTEIHRNAVGEGVDKLAEGTFRAFAGIAAAQRSFDFFFAFAFFEAGEEKFYFFIAKLAIASHFLKHLPVPCPAEYPLHYTTGINRAMLAPENSI